MDAGEQKARVRRQFSIDSADYAVSASHARGDSLKRAVELLRPGAGLLVDVATGAGHTALALAGHCRRVVACDLTPSMLATARRLFAERGVSNISFLLSDSERLAIAPGVADYVTTRIAPHHFPDLRAAAGEMARLLRPGGTLLYIDNIAPENPEAAAYWDAFERLRDPSHCRLETLPALVGLLEGAGLEVLHTETLRKTLSFTPWVERMRVPPEDRAELLRLLADSPPGVRLFFRPREEEGGWRFDEVEGILLARKP